MGVKDEKSQVSQRLMSGVVVSAVVSVFLIYTIMRLVFSRLIKKPSHQTATRRQVDSLEQHLHLLPQERQGALLLVLLRSKVKLVKEYVPQALVLLAKRQPMLRALITATRSQSTSGKDKHFEIINGDEIIELIDFTTSDTKARDWQDVWFEITSNRRETGLLWQAVLLKEEFTADTENFENTLIFRFNHACVDGVSSIKFCNQFLSYLHDVALGSGSVNNEQISSLSLSPSVLDLLKNGQSWSVWKFVTQCWGIRHMYRLIIRKAVRCMLARQEQNPLFVQFPPDKVVSSPRSNLMFKVFSVAETSHIVKACRSNGCTVTGVLMTASHIAFCRLLQVQNSSSKQLTHAFPIDAKRHCQPKPDEEYLGQFGICETFTMQYTDQQDDFWKLARDTTKRIHRLVEEKIYVANSLATFDGFSPEECVNEMTSSSDRLELLRLSKCNIISSAGSFQFDEGRHCLYKVHECLFYSPCHLLTNAFVHFSTTVNGKMAWVIIYDPSMVNSEQAEQFSNLCFSFLVELE